MPCIPYIESPACLSIAVYLHRCHLNSGHLSSDLISGHLLRLPGSNQFSTQQPKYYSYHPNLTYHSVLPCTALCWAPMVSRRRELTHGSQGSSHILSCIFCLISKSPFLSPAALFLSQLERFQIPKWAKLSQTSASSQMPFLLPRNF